MILIVKRTTNKLYAHNHINQSPVKTMNDNKIEITVDGKLIKIMSVNPSFELCRFEDFTYLTTKKVTSILPRISHIMSIEEFRKNNPLFSFLKEDVLLKEYYAYKAKCRYAYFKKEYGISAFNLRKILNAKMKEVWIVDPHLFKKFCFSSRGKPDKNKVHLLKKNFDLLKQVKIKSNLPLVLYLGISESELPSFFGEENWKEVSQNSEYRNIVLVRKAFRDYLTLSSSNQNEYISTIARDLFMGWNKIKNTSAIRTLSSDTGFELAYIYSNIFTSKELRHSVNTWSKSYTTKTTNYDLVKGIEKIAVHGVWSEKEKSHIKQKYNPNWTRHQWEKAVASLPELNRGTYPVVYDQYFTQWAKVFLEIENCQS